MKIIYLNDEVNNNLPPLVATIGFFDGVHRGHRFLIEEVKQKARFSGMQSAVITFDNHPRQVLHPHQHLSLLSSFAQKIKLIEATGVDICIILHFDKALSLLHAKDFMQSILSERLHVTKLIIGYDNKFGYGCKESFEDYQRYGQELGIEVIKATELNSNKEHISSSVIRRLITLGEIKAANKALGYNYVIEGQVIEGYHNGHKLGYPTANIDRKTCFQLIPAEGVYAVKVKTDLSPLWLNGMLYIGVRPTYNGKTLCIETNIFNFNKSLYGHNIKVSFIQRVRGERKFDTLSALSSQLANDKKQCEEILKESI